MSKTYVQLTGEIFELSMGNGLEQIPHGKNADISAIFDTYKTCSKLKWDAWKKWHDWAVYSDNVSAFRISSHNSHRYVIECVYTSPKGEIYLIKITKDHNYAKQVRFICS